VTLADVGVAATGGLFPLTAAPATWGALVSGVVGLGAMFRGVEALRGE
jgi:hypothetical protein